MFLLGGKGYSSSSRRRRRRREKEREEFVGSFHFLIGDCLLFVWRDDEGGVREGKNKG
jgi:hypothetical protein